MAKDNYWHYSVKINIDVPAPYYFEMHKIANIANLRDYFQSGKFSYSDETHIVHFLNGLQRIGGAIEAYKYENGNTYAEFKVVIPFDQRFDFETEYYNYIDPRPA